MNSFIERITDPLPKQKVADKWFGNYFGCYGTLYW